MFLLILFATIVFLFIAFIANLPTNSGLTPFIAYIQTEMQFISSHFIIFIFGFLIALVLFIISQKFDRKYSLFKNYFFATVQVFTGTVASFFLSFVALFIIAAIELNISALLINNNPSLLGIQTNTQNIVNAIKANDAPPQIVASDKDQSKELLAVAMATTGTTNFYGKYALSAIPTFFIIPVKKSDTSLLFIDNTLIITALNPDDLQQISPLLGYLFLKDYFWARPVKSAPHLMIMNRNQYEQYRLADAKKKVQQIDVDSKKLTSYESSLSASINRDQTQLATPIIRPGSAAANALSEKIQNEQELLTQYQYYGKFFYKQKLALQNQENNVPNELGVFEPKDSIRIALDTTSPHETADYLETVTHEYLHYASYISEAQKFTDAFFEEGLTEYFARNIIQKELQTPTNLGYPVQVKIITEMTKRIPESELADIYFTKDEGRLEDTLDQTYGDGFYENNQILFETLQYTSDPQQTLKLANIIMNKISGTPLTEKDLFSNYSKL